MANDLNQSLYVEDEIDFRKIIKILIESKKLLISTILFFTIASIIYSASLKPSFETSTNIEVGYISQNNNGIELIESLSDLTSYLKVLKIKNPDGIFIQDVSINTFEDKIINLKTTSSSAEQNEILLTEVINYIDERHSGFVLLLKDRISYKIDLIESELSFLEEKIKFDLEANTLKLQNDLPIIDQEIRQLNQVIIQDSNNLNLLKGTTLSLERALNSPTLEQIISSYKSKINLLKRERNIIVLDLSISSHKLDTINNGTFQSDLLLTLKQSLRSAEDELQILITQAQVKTQPIGDFETINIKPKTQLIISLGIIFGFITSVFFVLIINFIKRHIESQA
jgi:LPS O-antigen subunit length determinant protein (WzzB/FepE family)